MPKVKAKESPILFSGSMVRAIRENRKTMTRRIIKPQPPHWANEPQKPVGQWQEFQGCHPVGPCESEACAHIQSSTAMFTVKSPYFVGQRLWVQETFALDFELNVLYRATDEKPSPMGPFGAKKVVDGVQLWRRSVHMPRWASRLTLEVVSVRAERLQGISEADAIAEGCEMEDGFPKQLPHESGMGEIGWDCARDWFADLWDSINGKKSPWARNDWVRVVEFKRVEEAK